MANIGCSRGIGYGLAKNLLERTNSRVIATARSLEESSLLQELVDRFGPDRIVVPYLDVTKDSSFEDAKNQLSSLQIDSIDVLIGNAAIVNSQHPHDSLFESSPEEVIQVFNTNVVGNIRLLQHFTPMVLKSKLKMIVMMSSTQGSIDNAAEYGEKTSYRISKAALNMMSVLYAIDPLVKDNGAKVLIIHPGHVRTDMGSAGGQQPKVELDESTNCMIDLIEKVAAYQLRKQNVQSEVLQEYEFSNNLEQIEGRENFNEVVSKLDADNFVFTTFDGNILAW